MLAISSSTAPPQRIILWGKKETNSSKLETLIILKTKESLMSLAYWKSWLMILWKRSCTIGGGPCPWAYAGKYGEEGTCKSSLPSNKHSSRFNHQKNNHSSRTKNRRAQKLHLMDQTPWGEGVSGVQRLPEYTAFGDELFQFFLTLTNFFVFLQIKSVQFLQIPKLTLRFREGETLLPWTKRLEREGKLLRIERGGVGTRGDESGCKPEWRSRCVDASVSHLLVRWNPDFVAGEAYPSAIWGFFLACEEWLILLQ